MNVGISWYQIIHSVHLNFALSIHKFQQISELKTDLSPGRLSSAGG